jgi:hypothetical protein
MACLIDDKDVSDTVFTGWQQYIDVVDAETGEIVKVDLSGATVAIGDKYKLIPKE